MRKSALLALALASMIFGAAPAVALTFPDRGRAAVVDAAHVLPAAAAAALNARVSAWDNATGHQLAIVTLPSLQGDDIADYGYKLGRAWGLGRKGINDGALLIIAPLEHRVRIEVGRGLEGDLTDAGTSAILQEAVVPKLKAGDIAGAADAGADAIMAAIPANAGDLANAPKPEHGNWDWAIALGLLIVAIASAAWLIIRFRREVRASDKRIAAARAEVAAPYRSPPRFIDPPIYQGASSIRPAQAEASRSTNIIAPVIVNAPSYDSSRSFSSSSSDSGSSSSCDFGSSSSSGFDSGGGDFGGGGSDSSW